VTPRRRLISVTVGKTGRAGKGTFQVDVVFVGYVEEGISFSDLERRPVSLGRKKRHRQPTHKQTNPVTHRRHTPPPASAPQHVYAETLPINKTPKILERIPFELLIHRAPLPPTFPAILLHLPQFCLLISGRRTSKSLDNGTIHLVHPFIEFIRLDSFDPS